MYSQKKKANKIIIPFVILLLLSATSHAKNHDPIDQEKECLAKVIYHEARGESDLGKKSVAKIVINRKQHKAFPKTICQVVNQVAYIGRKKVCQFSWVCNKPKLKHNEMWNDSLELSDAILNDRIELPKFGPNVLFFRSTSSRQSFGKGYKLVSTIGHAKFYEKKII